MTLTQVLPLAIAALEFAAGLVYAYNGRWWLAMAWVCYGVACVGLAMAGE